MKSAATFSAFRARFPSAPRLLALLERVVGIAGWAAVAGVFLYAGILRADTPRIPVSDPDTWGYLFPALSWIDGQGFVQLHGRDWLYPAFLAFCLKLGGFPAIVLLQQILGLAAGVFFVLAARSWSRLLPVHRGILAAVPLVVSGFLWIFLCNPQTVLFETQIRPEAIINCAVFVQLFCVLQYVHARWGGAPPSASVVWGALAMVFAYTAYLLKPSWALAVPITCLPVAAGAFQGWRFRLSGLYPVALAAVLMAGFFVLPKKLFFVPDATSRTFLPMVLFAIHADLIQDHLHAPGSPVGEDPAGREFLALFDREMAVARSIDHNYETLGFDPDYLMFKSPIFFKIKEYAGGTNEAFRTFCLKQYGAAIRANPAGWVRKVAGQMGHFFGMKESTVYRHRIDWRKEWRSSTESLPRDLTAKFSGRTAADFERYLEEMAPLAESPAETVGPGLLRQWVRKIVNSLAAWEVLFLAALGAALCWPSLRSFLPAGAMALVLFGASFGNALTVAIIHALDISRYRYSYGPPLLLAIFAIMVFTIGVAGSAAVAVFRKFRLKLTNP